MQQWSAQYSPVYYVNCQDCSLKPFFQSLLRAMQVENLVGHRHTLYERIQLHLALQHSPVVILENAEKLRWSEVMSGLYAFRSYGNEDSYFTLILSGNHELMNRMFEWAKMGTFSCSRSFVDRISMWHLLDR